MKQDGFTHPNGSNTNDNLKRLSYRKPVHNIMNLANDEERTAMEMVNSIVGGEIIVVTDKWWIIVGDDKVKQRYEILKELTPNMPSLEKDKLFARIDAVK